MPKKTIEIDGRKKTVGEWLAELDISPNVAAKLRKAQNLDTTEDVIRSVIRSRKIKKARNSRTVWVRVTSRSGFYKTIRKEGTDEG